MFKLGVTQRQDCRLYRGEKADSVQIACHCLALAYKRYRTLGRVFLTAKDLDNMRVNDIKSLVTNTRLGMLLCSQSNKAEIVRNYLRFMCP